MVTIMSSSSASSTLYANRSMVTFTCHVTIDDNVDTSVTLNLTWTRVFHDRETEIINITTETINGSNKMVMKELLLTNLTSQDKMVECTGRVNSDGSFIQSSGERRDKSIISVIGE